MKWIYCLLLLTPLHVGAALIDYRLTGGAQELVNGQGTENHDIRIDFTADTDNDRWTNFTLFFLGDTWTTIAGSPNDLFVWSTEPDVTVPTYWMRWFAIVTNGSEVFTFKGASEWKWVHDGSGTDPLSNLDKSFISSELITNSDGRQFGYGGVIEKLSSVPEPSTLALLCLSLTGLGVRRRLSS